MRQPAGIFCFAEVGATAGLQEDRFTCLYKTCPTHGIYAGLIAVSKTIEPDRIMVVIYYGRELRL